MRVGIQSMSRTLTVLNDKMDCYLVSNVNFENNTQ
jgi:hypothetical protein